MPTKDEMICALQNAQVVVPPTATISQIRQLYEQTACKSEVRASAEPRANPDDNSPASEVSVNNLECIAAGVGPGAEIAALRSRLEMLELRQRIAALEAGNAAPSPPLPPVLPNFEEIIAKFSGDGEEVVERWFRELEGAFQLHQIDDRGKLYSTRRLLTGTAALLARSVDVNTYDELKGEVISAFTKTAFVEGIYRKLRARRLSRSETVTRYFLEMIQIAGDAIAEEELIIIILDGIGDPINTAAMRFAAKSMKDLKELLKSYEKMRPTITRASPTPAAAMGKRETNEGSSSPRCYNCSQFGHHQAACPLPRRPSGSCFNCHQVGHSYRQCKNKPIINSAAAYRHLEGVNDEVVLEENQNVSVTLMFNGKWMDTSTLMHSLFDTGSPVSFIAHDMVPKQLLQSPTPSGFLGLGSTMLTTLGRVECQVRFRGEVQHHTLIILPSKSLAWPVIVGRDLLKKFNIHLTRTSHRNALNGDNKLLPLSSLQDNLSSHNVADVVPQQSRKMRLSECKDAQLEAFTEICAIDVHDDARELALGEDLSKEERTDVLSLIQKNYTECPLENIDPPNHKMKIRLTHDIPQFTKPRRLSYGERNQVRDIVRDLLDKNIIRPSNSPYASALVLVRKKNGEIRMCVDYRPLNKITIRDNYPLPLIETCLEHLSNKRFFTLLDLKSGFHQVQMHEDSVQYTSFVTPDGQYEFLNMPFGLKNAPSEFQRFMNSVLREFVEAEKLVVYLDDIIIATADFNSHLEIVSAVLKKIRQSGLELRIDKCKFAYQELDYLGYKTNSSGICPSDKHVNAIRNYPMPTNTKQLRRCLGLFSYFRRFVPSFSCIAKPLTTLLSKDTPFIFDSTCEKAFKTLREKLIQAPVLALFDAKRETVLHCDASSSGFGAVLLQRQTDGKLHPIAYFSRTTSKDEAKLHSYELETLAVIYALKRFHVYVHGIPIKIVTDCSSLVATLKNSNTSAKIARWSLFLENYDYEMQYRPGATMSHVDALSRTEAVGAISEVDLDFQLHVAQMRDPDVEALKCRLESEEVSEYALQDNVVYRKSPSNRLQLYVPREMVDNVIRHAHEKIGHLAVDKTYDMISRHYWFPGMKRTISNFVKNCLKCIVHSAPARKNYRNLFSIPKAAVPFDTLHVDHLGPLPSLRSKKKYILVVVDAFTKFTKLYPTSSTSSVEACASLNQYMSYYSRPRRVISDRGTCFTSGDFKDFLNHNGVTHVLNATASPQANGQVERVNRVLSPILSKLSDPVDQADWCIHLRSAEYALNNTVHATTGFPPSVLLYGVEQRGPCVDELTEFLDEKNNCVNRNLQSIRSVASANILKSQHTNEHYFREHHKPAQEFQEGDYVAIRHTHTSTGSTKKLAPKYRGPYIVHKTLPNDRYVIKDIPGCQITQLPYDGILEADKLKKWISPD